MIIDELAALLNASGLTAGYTMQTVANPQQWQKTKRYILLRGAGAGGDRMVRNVTYQVHYISRVNDLLFSEVMADANAMIEYLLAQNFATGCIINCALVLDLSGPYVLEDNRSSVYFEIGVKSQ